MSHDAASTPLRVLLDVDTGVDNALALLLAARHPGVVDRRGDADRAHADGGLPTQLVDVALQVNGDRYVELFLKALAPEPLR